MLNFVKQSQDQLSANPKSLEEIEAMNKAAMEIESKKQGISDIFEGLQKKNLMIKQSKG